MGHDIASAETIPLQYHPFIREAVSRDEPLPFSSEVGSEEFSFYVTHIPSKPYVPTACGCQSYQDAQAWRFAAIASIASTVSILILFLYSTTL